jgi:hypothetical protein
MPCITKIHGMKGIELIIRITIVARTKPMPIFEPWEWKMAASEPTHMD